MTRVPPSQPGRLVNPQQSGSNGLGIAGFVVSLVGLVGFCDATMALLSVVGTVLSAVAMRKQPRGLAIAGLVMGLIGCVWLLVAVVLIGGIMTAGLMGGLGVAKGLQADAAGASIVTAAAEAYKTSNGKMPTDINDLVKGQWLEPNPKDRNGHPLYIKVVTGNKVEVWSTGSDNQQGTMDDRELMGPPK